MRLSAFFFFARLEEEEEEDAVVAAGALLLEGWSGIPMLAATPAAGAAAVKALFFIIHELSAAFGMGSRQPRSGAAREGLCVRWWFLVRGVIVPLFINTNINP
jgi:hypothetical protein